MTTRSPLLAAAVLVLIVSRAGSAQAPADLRAAAQARNLAVAQADAATWDKRTCRTVIVVVPWGTMTKAQRSAQIKQQKPTTAPPVQHEQFQAVGTAFLHRYQIENGSILEVWVRDRGSWRVATVQATGLDPDSAAVHQAITAANARFIEAFKRADPATLSANYTDDAVLMPPNLPAWEGRAGLRQAFTSSPAHVSPAAARLDANA